jgi:predicted RNase H-like HicB family nuclease
MLMEHASDMRDCLAAPYLLRVETVRDRSGAWLRRASCPELPGCAVECETIEDAVEQLERRRAQVIRALLEQGKRPSVARPPVPPPDAPARGAEAADRSQPGSRTEC